MYHDHIGTIANYDSFGISIQGRVWVAITMASNEVKVCNQSIGDLAKHDGNAAWQTWELYVQNYSAWIFLDGVFRGRRDVGAYGNSSVNCSQLGWTTGGMKTHIDSLTIASPGGVAQSMVF